MRLFLIYILTISSFCSSAQSVTDTIISDIKYALQSKHIRTLNSYIESEQHYNFIQWKTFREIVDNRHEGVLQIEIIRKGDSTGNVDNFSINLLADNDHIFFYELTKTIFKRKNATDYESYPIVVDAYKDLTAYQTLDNLFTATYYSPMDTMDLFQTSIVYGSSCGLGGSPTKYQNKLDSLLLAKDIQSILSWLKSPNTEKQLYAIQGLRALQKNGYNITPEEIRLIEIISNKKGRVNVCEGCTYSSNKIKDVALGINEWQGYYSVSQKANKSNRLIYWGILNLIFLVSMLIYYFKLQTQRGGVQQ